METPWIRLASVSFEEDPDFPGSCEVLVVALTGRTDTPQIRMQRSDFSGADAPYLLQEDDSPQNAHPLGGEIADAVMELVK